MIAATFHGPNHFVPNYDETTIEVFESVGHALSSLFDRYDDKGEHNLPVRYLNGTKIRVPFPHVELGDYFQCYEIPNDFAAMPGDEGITEEALTAVHADLWSFRLRLMRPFGWQGEGRDGIAVSVEKRIEAL